MAADKSRGRKWDGISRVSNDLYRKDLMRYLKKRKNKLTCNQIM